MYIYKTTLNRFDYNFTVSMLLESKVQLITVISCSMPLSIRINNSASEVKQDCARLK